MKKYFLFILLIILSFVTISTAGMGMSGSIVKKKPDGEVIRVELYGDLMLGPDSIMGNAVVKGWGQFLLRTSDADPELRTASPISSITEKEIILNLKGTTKSFLIMPDTIFCDINGKQVGLEAFSLEEMVTVSSKLDESAASTVRQGSLYFTGVMTGSPELKDIGCIK